MIDFHDRIGLRHEATMSTDEERRLWGRVLSEIRLSLALGVSSAVLFGDDDVVHLPRKEIAETVHNLGIIVDYLLRRNQ